MKTKRFKELFITALIAFITTGSAGLSYADVITAISAGGSHTVAPMPDGGVTAWGANAFGQLGNGTTTDSPTPVTVKGIGGVGVLTGVIAISAGGNHTVALMSDGTVTAWGANAFGQLGDGTATSRPTPVAVKGIGGTGVLSGVIAISAGGDHTVALMSDGTVTAWGANAFGQLGDGTATSRPTPVAVKGIGGTGVLSGVIAISAGGDHTVALMSDGTLTAWGLNAYGQLGDGTTTSRPTPVAVKGIGGTGVLSGVIAISAGKNPISGGEDHTVALMSDGTLTAWGANAFGQIGDGTTTSRPSPVTVSDVGGAGVLSGVIDISAGGDHTVALMSDGTVTAWGLNAYGQLGDGTTISSLAPVTVEGIGGVGFLTGVIAVFAGGNHTVALMSDGTLTAWGLNSNGQLGDGTSTSSLFPIFTKFQLQTVRIFNGISYPSIQEAYNHASSGDVIEALGTITFTETLLFDRPVNVTFQGGFNLFFNKITGLTIVRGSLTISNGSATVENLLIM